MNDPEDYRQQRDRLRAEIEAQRTPEQRAEAEAIRAQRAAYAALPNDEKNRLEELELFEAFSATAVAGIDAGSGVSARPPEPDIHCSVAGRRYYFELGEITDRSVSRTMADALKFDEPRGCAYSYEIPLEYIIGKKRTRKYETDGFPIDLILYFRTQAVPWDLYLSELIEAHRDSLRSLLMPGGPFFRVWIFAFHGRRVLWHS